MLSIKAPAKINLFLEITARRSDGFHNLSSVFQTIPLYDKLTVTPANTITLNITNTKENIPTDHTNLVLQAATALQRQCGITAGARFSLTKNIPSQSGLGGGSSDAAAALLLANELWKTNLNREELAAIGAVIGSDVPFFIYGGTCLCEGRGEIITPLPDIEPLSVGIIAPPWGIPTPKAFSILNPAHFNQHNVQDFINILRQEQDNLAAIHDASFNHFEAAICDYEPRQQQLHTLLQQHRSLARMSGSGSAVYFLASPDSLPQKLPAGCRIIL